MVNAFISDLRDDFAELSYLITDALWKLRQFDEAVHTHKRHMTAAMHKEATTATKELRMVYESLQHDVQKARTQLEGVKTLLPAKINTLRATRMDIKEMLRANQGLLGSLITMTDWQSPSYDGTATSQAGIQTGGIYATINDYKRDQHRDALWFEQAYRKQYIDAPMKLLVNVYACASGMAAVTTVLNFLVMEGKTKRPILLGKNSYFQNKELITRLFPGNVIEVDEADTKRLLTDIETYQPSALFLDTLANTETMVMPNLLALFDAMKRVLKEDTYLVLDTSCTSISYQPFRGQFTKASKLQLIVIESLNKFHQYGMDRVTGGVISAYGKNTGKLFDYRVHSGTNIPDSLVRAIPTPDRKMLDKRLGRHGRNTTMMVQALTAYLANAPSKKIDRIVYPSLATHPSNAWAEQYPFHGTFFTIQFRQHYQTIPVYKKFVAIVLAEAKKAHIPIIAGTSFGLDRTRIYLTAVRATTTTPFIRVAVGAEDVEEIEHLTQVFMRVISKF